jgi:hypothetical protein
MFKIFRNCWLASNRPAVSLYPSAKRLCTSADEEAVAVAEIALAMHRHSHCPVCGHNEHSIVEFYGAA